jgi:hypothetical protein
MPKRRLYLEGINGDDLARQVDFWKRFLAVLHTHAPDSRFAYAVERRQPRHQLRGRRATPSGSVLFMPHNYVDVMREVHSGFPIRH